MRLRIARRASEDLTGIFVYVGERNRLASDRLRISFQEAFGRLLIFPRSGLERDDLPGTLRSIVVKSYVVLYSVAANEVTVARVIDSRRDLKAVLDDE